MMLCGWLGGAIAHMSIGWIQTFRCFGGTPGATDGWLANCKPQRYVSNNFRCWEFSQCTEDLGGTPGSR